MAYKMHHIDLAGYKTKAPVSKDAKKRGAAVLKPLKGSHIINHPIQKDLKLAKKLGEDVSAGHY